MEYRFWSNKIVNVLRYKSVNKHNFLFGISGDLDNLGVFVSQHGRAVAENLVEVYNHIIGSYCQKFVKEHSDIKEFALLPSGEEIFAIGVADNKDIVDLFFSKLHTDINKMLSASPIKADYVTISFGTKIFEDINVSEVINNIDSGDVFRGNTVFLDLMLDMRKQLALELDKDKFKSLDCDSLAIFFRNCVYAKMREYKTTTKRVLVNLSHKIKSDPEFKKLLEKSILNKDYGTDDDSVEHLVQLLSDTTKVVLWQ